MAEEEWLPPRRRRLALATVFMAISMAVLDGAIANVALPTIARDVHASPAASIWVVNAYQLAVTVSLLPLASLGEIYGYRRVYQAGLFLFTLASLLCALSTSLPELAVVRVVQGFGASGIMSVNAALVRFIMPRNLLGRGIGMNALVVAVASAVGPTVASAILSVAAWPWLFAINVPIGIVAQLVALGSLPVTPRSPHRFEWADAGLSAVMFGLVIVAIDGIGHAEGWSVPAVAFAGSALAAVLLVRRTLGQPAPMLPLDLFRRPIFALSAATAICSFAAQGLAYVSLPFYFQDVLGRSEVATGLLMTPWPLTVAIAAPIAGRLADRYPAGVLGGIGLAVLGAGLLLVALMPAHPANFDIIWRMTLCGAGFGFFQSPNGKALIESAPRERTGGASGIMSTSRLLGQTTGAALVALAFSLAGAAGTTTAIVVAASFSAMASIVSILRLMNTAPPAGAGEMALPGPRRKRR
ncbi:MAG TPA: MFS transporter [Acetobacteraceae bacterium]|nr:MFS transporter [Acetobacteraceae bacterium]